MDLVQDLLTSVGMSLEDVPDVGLPLTDRLDRLSAEQIHELARLAAPEMVKRWDTPIGEMFPGSLRWQSQPVTRASLKARVYNALGRSGVGTLGRSGVGTWGDVAELTPRQLFEIRTIGWLAVIEIVTSSVEQWLRSYQSGGATDDRAAPDPDGELEEPPESLSKEDDRLEATLGDSRHSEAWSIDVASWLGALRIAAAWGVRNEMRSVWTTFLN